MKVIVKAKASLVPSDFYDTYNSVHLAFRYKIKGVASGKGGFTLLLRGGTEGQDRFLKRVADYMTNMKDEIKEKIEKKVTDDIESEGNSKLVKKLLKKGISFEFEYKKGL